MEIDKILLEKIIKEAEKEFYVENRNLIEVNELCFKEYKGELELYKNKNPNQEIKETNVGERANVFRFGLILNEKLKENILFKDYDLDCEYNRSFYGPKILYGKVTYPDLIIHKRKSNDSNLLVMEFKGWWNKSKRGIKKDKLKLFGFVNDSDYNYSYGTFIIMGKNSFNIEWTINNKLIK